MAELTYKVRVIETLEFQDWTIKAMLEEINRDRSEHWTNYTEEDFLEGWNEWVEGEHYSLVEDKTKYYIDTIKEGTVITQFYKINELGALYFWGSHEKWVFATHGNQNIEGFYKHVKEEKGTMETTKQVVHKFLGTV